MARVESASRATLRRPTCINLAPCLPLPQLLIKFIMARVSKLPPTSDAVTQFRATLGMRLITLSAVGVTVLAALVLIGAGIVEYKAQVSGAFKDTAQLLFSALLPLFGTWVGTVLAFYFSKENFEAANSHTLDVLRATGIEKLRSIPVSKGMIPLAQMVTLPLPASGTLTAAKCADVQAKFDVVGNTGQRISRLVILDASNKSVAVLHRSIWAELISLGLQQKPPVDLANDTLGPMIGMAVRGIDGFATYGDLISGAIAYVKTTDTLAEAKAAMESVTYCQDVMVTQSGDKTTPVIGWITNADLGRLSEA